MTSPIRGASSSSYYNQTNSPESSPPPHNQSSSHAQSSGFPSLQRMNASRRTAGSTFNARFSDENTSRDLPDDYESRQADISVREDTKISQEAYQLWINNPTDLPSDVKKKTKKDRKLYAAYKEIRDNKGYKASKGYKG
ncbi:hypothetical protein [Xanthomonas cerealis]|uniref:Type III effector protein n=1 Tax=Xanthomonas cerealis pv. cerealis TaxID=152263 RepID=A0A514EFF6_9XANT|nr:hypothetical protein [Xanthomonas translucens]QDI04769.1 hypothetical protein E4A48_14670 [Xanthomonas translucens pv. cerealis]UKE46784.1 hypothetical protein KHA79_17195 [Xanthomonas translucens pv. cerealis]